MEVLIRDAAGIQGFLSCHYTKCSLYYVIYVQLSRLRAYFMSYCVVYCAVCKCIHIYTYTSILDCIMLYDSGGAASLELRVFHMQGPPA